MSTVLDGCTLSGLMVIWILDFKAADIHSNPHPHPPHTHRSYRGVIFPLKLACLSPKGHVVSNSVEFSFVASTPDSAHLHLALAVIFSPDLTYS